LEKHTKIKSLIALLKISDLYKVIYLFICQNVVSVSHIIVVYQIQINTIIWIIWYLRYHVKYEYSVCHKKNVKLMAPTEVRYCFFPTEASKSFYNVLITDSALLI